jgi:hypothetical protein
MHTKLNQLVGNQSDNINLDYSYIINSIKNASDIIAPAWTLRSFVASNPLQGLEKSNFSDALKTAKEFYKTDIFSDRVNLEELLKTNKIEESQVINKIKNLISQNYERFYFSTHELIIDDFIRSVFIKNTTYKKTKYSNNAFEIFKHSFYFELKDTLKNQVEPVYYHLYRSEKLIDRVSLSLIKFLELYFDNDNALFKMPSKEKGFYLSWKELAIYDDYKSKTKKEVINFINNLSIDPLEAIDTLIKDFEIDKNVIENFFRTCLAHLPGWSSFVKWKTDYDNEDNQINTSINLVELLAVRLCIKKIAFIEDPNINAYQENLSLESKQITYLNDFFNSLINSGLSEEKILSSDVSTLKRVLGCYAELKNKKTILLLEVFEGIFHEQIKEKINLNLKKLPKDSRAKAQLVFCIDVRSEPFRKKLESINNYQTFGFAGFFGIPIQFKDYEEELDCASCPVLLKPKHIVKETFAKSDGLLVLQRKEKNTIANDLNLAIKEVCENIASAYSFVEITGASYGITSILKTIMPKFTNNSMLFLSTSLNTKPNYEIYLSSQDTSGQEIGIKIDDQYQYARQALKMIGLVDNFAQVVIFAGHGSTTTNNAYATALDCGACGGNHGGPNARVLAKILNNKFIREKLLRLDQIRIPEDTIFVAAEHNTTTDDFNFLEESDNKLPEKLKHDLLTDLKYAKKINNDYRQKTFATQDDPDKRAVNWSETRPEWGLARNACFIIGKRELTKNSDLESRAFLHSYDYSIDEDGSILETIMTAPMIVTQWINAQYLFSSMNNCVFGSGSKVTQNILGKFAVCQGNSSDLMHGLAMQSVQSSDENLYHIPQRIINYIYAPKDRVESIINKHDILKRLIYNSWIKVVVIDPHDNQFHSLF